MEIPLSFNIGDTVWLWRHGKISSDTVRRIWVKMEKDENTEITYETTHYDQLRPEDEKRFWFRTRQEVVDYVNKTVLNPPPPEPTPNFFGTIFEDVFGKK